ncbi:MAG: FKBP-type peptidyl-prolyl cis-trans isomerase [Burkholderiaceae bacterium]
MKIDDGALVSLDIAMYDAQGNLLEKSDEPLTYLHGHDDMLARIEEELTGKEPGAELALQLEPEEAFGDYDPDLIMLMPLESVGEGVEVGMRVEGNADDGSASHIFTISDIADGMAVLDGNHPLAGMALRFAIKVVEVRQASAEELEDAESPRLPDFLRLPEPPDRTLH